MLWHKGSASWATAMYHGLVKASPLPQPQDPYVIPLHPSLRLYQPVLLSNVIAVVAPQHK
jgi:hypothetical protein